MKTIIVGSENPIKLATTKEAFAIVFPEETFEYVTFAATSDVPDQPMGIMETKQGAMNRASHCRTEYPDADFFVGLEGGLEEIEGEFWTSAWMCVQDTTGKCGYGRTGAFLLPPVVSELIHQDRKSTRLNSSHPQHSFPTRRSSDLCTRYDRKMRIWSNGCVFTPPRRE